MIKCWKLFPICYFWVSSIFFSPHLLIFRVCCGAFVVGASLKFFFFTFLSTCNSTNCRHAPLNCRRMVERRTRGNKTLSWWRKFCNFSHIIIHIFWKLNDVSHLFLFLSDFFFSFGVSVCSCVECRSASVIGLGYSVDVYAWAQKSGFVRRQKWDVAAHRRRFLKKWCESFVGHTRRWGWGSVLSNARIEESTVVNGEEIISFI